MIIGAVMALMAVFGTGGTFSFEKVFEPFVKDAVADEARSDQIVEILEQTDEDMKAYQAQVEDVWSEKLKTLVNDYDATKDDFRQLRNEANGARTKMLEELLDTRFSVVGLMTEDEWNAMQQAMAAKAAKAKQDS